MRCKFGKDAVRSVTHTITILVISTFYIECVRSHVGGRGRESAGRAVSVYRMYGNACAGWGSGAKGISSRPPNRLTRNWKRILGF